MSESPNITYIFAATASAPLFDRGFTGHEHLYGFGLKNMNGRMYDPIMSSFLSVDNYVQSPENSQNFNRYAYCLNNPLKYTDPDGEFWHLVIGAAIGGTINLLTNLNNIDNFGQGLAYFGIGALAGGLSAGIGAGFSSVIGAGTFSAGFLGTGTAAVATTSFASGAAIGAASGFTGSFITCTGNAWMQGEDFTEGLGTGVFGGLVGMGSGALLGGICGGIDAWRNGREFWSGDYKWKLSCERFYPTGDQYIQPGPSDCTVTTAKVFHDYHNPSDPMSVSEIRTEDWIEGTVEAVNDGEFWEMNAGNSRHGVKSMMQYTCDKYGGVDHPLIDMATVWEDFSNGADVAVSLDTQLVDSHTVAIQRMETTGWHRQWGTGKLVPRNFKVWVQDPMIGRVSPTPFHGSFNNKALNVFILKY